MGAWIEMYLIIKYLLFLFCRTPRWVRGLKLPLKGISSFLFMSHPTMGAWIEIAPTLSCSASARGRTPRWVRGLKYIIVDIFYKKSICRTPRWVRGLKFYQNSHLLHY